MEYVSKNQGLLAVSMVKTGDKLIIIEDAYSTFSEKKQMEYWNCKVQLPDGSHKLAGLMDSVCDKMAEKWGSNTANWTGHTLQVEIKTAKNSGNPYIWLVPTDDAIVDVEAMRKEKFQKEVKEQEANNAATPKEPTVPYPTEQIDPNDIPF